MQIVNTIKEVREIIKKSKANGESVGFVPTMGYLHKGHLSLMEQSKAENGLTVVSIFVNPTQFGPSEDLDTYPRDLNRDIKLMESLEVDLVFIPSVEEMYPEGSSTFVTVEGNITRRLCGASRDGHFKGVTTVVAKLFNIFTPDKAYFGQKDAQQVAVIEKMVKDLDINVEIVPCPIVREEDGLALSSRNTFLSKEERKDALILSKTLFEAKYMILNGEKDAIKIKRFITEKIQSVEKARIDYVEVVNAKTLMDIEEVSGDVLMAVAVWIGKPRLIDNVRLEA